MKDRVTSEYIIRDVSGLACSFNRDFTRVTHETDRTADRFTFKEAEEAIKKLKKTQGNAADFTIEEFIVWGCPNDHATVRELLNFSEDRDHRLIT